MSRLCRLKSYKNIGDDGKWAYSEIMQLRQQLAESQAREARLREALSELADLMEGVYTGYYHPDSFTNQTAREALALQHDDTALKEYMDSVIGEFVGKFKRHVGGDGEFWMHELEDFYQNTKAP